MPGRLIVTGNWSLIKLNNREPGWLIEAIAIVTVKAEVVKAEAVLAVMIFQCSLI